MLPGLIFGLKNLATIEVEYAGDADIGYHLKKHRHRDSQILLRHLYLRLQTQSKRSWNPEASCIDRVNGVSRVLLLNPLDPWNL